MHFSKLVVAGGAVEYNGHDWQILCVVAPITLEYFPVGHISHGASKSLSLYVPARQNSHKKRAVPFEPELHLHCDIELLPKADVDCNIHSLHELFPKLSLYLALSHFIQEPPSGPVDPALHLQFCTFGLEGNEIEFSGHFMQSCSKTEPLYIEYVPAEQLVHF